LAERGHARRDGLARAGEFTADQASRQAAAAWRGRVALEVGREIVPSDRGADARVGALQPADRACGKRMACDPDARRIDMALPGVGVGEHVLDPALEGVDVVSGLLERHARAERVRVGPGSEAAAAGREGFRVADTLRIDRARYIAVAGEVAVCPLVEGLHTRTASRADHQRRAPRTEATVRLPRA